MFVEIRTDSNDGRVHTVHAGLALPERGLRTQGMTYHPEKKKFMRRMREVIFEGFVCRIFERRKSRMGLICGVT